MAALKRDCFALEGAGLTDGEVLASWKHYLALEDMVLRNTSVRSSNIAYHQLTFINPAAARLLRHLTPRHTTQRHHLKFGVIMEDNIYIRSSVLQVRCCLHHEGLNTQHTQL